jgi:hypothetical protein
MVVALSAMTAVLASAQTTVALPDTSQTTTFTAIVSEQAMVTVPAAVAFNVTNTSIATAAPSATVTITNIVMATATKQLKVSVQAAAASFTPPSAGAPTWSASDIGWNASTWTNGTGATGTLSSAAYNQIATCAADAAGCNSSTLVFTVGAKPTVTRAGAHTLLVTWKFESIGA